MQRAALGGDPHRVRACREQLAPAVRVRLGDRLPGVAPGLEEHLLQIALRKVAGGLLARGAIFLSIWVVGLLGPGQSSSIIFPTLALMFWYLFGHMILLAILSELFLAHSDHRYLRRITEVLARETPSPTDPER